MTVETTVTATADQHRQQPAISETARHLYGAETALHVAPQSGVGAWISAFCNRLSEVIADHMRAIAPPQADAESPFRTPFEDRRCIPRMRQNGGSRAPYPRPAVTIRDVGRGTAMRRPEPPR